MIWKVMTYNMHGAAGVAPTMTQVNAKCNHDGINVACLQEAGPTPAPAANVIVAPLGDEVLYRQKYRVPGGIARAPGEVISVKRIAAAGGADTETLYYWPHGQLSVAIRLAPGLEAHRVFLTLPVGEVGAWRPALGVVLNNGTAVFSVHTTNRGADAVGLIRYINLTIEQYNDDHADDGVPIAGGIICGDFNIDPSVDTAAADAPPGLQGRINAAYPPLDEGLGNPIPWQIVPPAGPTHQDGGRLDYALFAHFDADDISNEVGDATLNPLSDHRVVVYTIDEP